MEGANALRTGEFSVVVAGGMESMSNTPYLLPKGRTGFGWATRSFSTL